MPMLAYANRSLSIFRRYGCAVAVAVALVSCATQPAARKTTGPKEPPPPPEIVYVPTEAVEVTGDLRTTLLGTDDFRLGIEREREDDYTHLKRKRVALVARGDSVDQDCIHTAERFAATRSFTFARLIVIEDGATTMTESLARALEAKPDLPVSHLSREQYRPTAAMLKNIDVVAFDVALPGDRASVELAVLGGTLEEASLRDVAFVVLDRPTRAGADAVRAPMPLETIWNTADAFLPIAAVPGLTAGEAALLFNSWFGIQARLKVVPMANYARGEAPRWSGDCGTMRELSPEYLDLAVAKMLIGNSGWDDVTLERDPPRLTLIPSEIDMLSLAERLGGMGLAGVVARPVVPSATLVRPHVEIVPSGGEIDPLLLSLQLRMAAWPQLSNYPQDAPNPYGSSDVFILIARGEKPAAIAATLAKRDDLEEYRGIRDKVLLYE